jgi:hypothetical protein
MTKKKQIDVSGPFRSQNKADILKDGKADVLDMVLGDREVIEESLFRLKKGDVKKLRVIAYNEKKTVRSIINSSIQETILKFEKQNGSIDKITT